MKTGKKSATNWEYLGSESDKGLDYSDIPKLGPAFWRKATLRMPQKMQSVTLRLDPDGVRVKRGGVNHEL